MSHTVRLWLAVVPAALAAGAVAVTLTLTSDHVEPPVLAAVLGGLAGFSFIAAGLIARTRRPENRTGLLLMAVAFAWFAATLSASNQSLVWTIGIAVGALFAAFLVHLLLAYPTGRLGSRWERAIVVTAYVLAGIGNIVLLPFDETPITDCAECPSNAFLVEENDTVTGVLTTLIELAALVLLTAVAATLALRWRRSSPPARRLLSPVLLAGGTAVFLLGLNVGTASLWPSLADAFGFGALLASIATPFLFLWGILRSHLARAGLGSLMRTDYSLADAQLESQRILRDPTAGLVVWLEERGGYIDAEGRPYRLPPESAERAVTEIADEEGPLGAFVHDPALRDEELLGDLTAALRLNLQKSRSTVALQASERRSRALLEALPDNMYRISRAGVYLDFHAQDPTQLRLSPETLIGSTVWDYPVPHQTTEQLMATAERTFESGSVETFEFEARLDDGTVLYREGRVMPSGPDEFLFITRDITDRKRSEQDLKSSEQRSRALLEAIPDSMFRISREGRILDYRIEPPIRLFRAEEDIIGSDVYDADFPREITDRTMALGKKAIDTGELQVHEYELEIDGKLHHQEARITPSGDDECVVIVRDVTERKRQEQELRLSGQRSRALIEVIPDTMFRINREGTFLDFHTHGTPLMPLESIVGSSAFDYPVPRELIDRVMAAGEMALATGELQTLEWELEIDGELRHQEGRVTGSGDDEYFMIIRDVTERKQQEQELQSERDFVAKVVNVAPTYFCVIHAEGRIVRYNDTLATATGLVDDENARGRLFQDQFVLPEEVAEFARRLQIAHQDGDTGEFELHLRSRTSELLDVLWRGVDIYDETGERGYLLCGLDVTVRKRQEEEQAALRRVAVAVATERRAEEVFGVVTEEVGRLLGAHTTLTARYEPGGEWVELVGAWGEDEFTEFRVGDRIRLEEGPGMMVYRTERPLRLDVDGEIPEPVAERLRERGVSSVVAAPIVVTGRLWGTVSASVQVPNLFPPGSEERIGEFTRLVSLALANAEAREQLATSRARIVEAGDTERRRLERNLHDGAQQRLVSLSLSLRLAQAKLASDTHAADELLSSASIELALALEELRELARGIHPAVLTERGLGPALESLADRAPIAVELQHVPEQRLPGPVEAAAYYVVAEALTNVAKYAGASLVSVRIAQENGRAVVEVTDDGVGGADPKRGTGLRGLTDRVEALEGLLAVESEPGVGTKVRAEIPFG